MRPETEYARQIISLIAASSITDLHLEIGDFKLILARQAQGGEPRQAATTTAPAAEGGRRAAAVSTGATQAFDVPAAARAGVAQPDVPGTVVTAPMVGTFYRAPAPGAAPFVEVGSLVTKDQTVCIVEVMKLMNEVRAGCRGRVTAIYVEDGTLVEYGQTLIVVDPAG
jgi:acetyl-CoA carboxylase biotin carboxyl carrier protein